MEPLVEVVSEEELETALSGGARSVNSCTEIHKLPFFFGLFFDVCVCVNVCVCLPVYATGSRFCIAVRTHYFDVATNSLSGFSLLALPRLLALTVFRAIFKPFGVVLL